MPEIRREKSKLTGLDGHSQSFKEKAKVRGQCLYLATQIPFYLPVKSTHSEGYNGGSFKGEIEPFRISI